MSENDKTSDLKPLLQTLGFSDVVFDTSSRTKTGGNLKPDLQFYLDNKYYVLEAKVPPSGYSAALEKANKDIKELMEPVEIAFAVLWPSGKGKIRAGYISNDGQTGQRLFSSLQELVDWIVISCKAKKVKTPLNESGLLDVLNKLVERFYQHYKKIPIEDIQVLFGGKSFFETVLSESGEKEEVQSLRKVAAFLLVNQMFFYGILAKRTGKYTEIVPDKVIKPLYLQELFDKVLHDDYAPVFGVPVLKLSDDKALGADLKYCATTINELLKHELSHDILGKVFHNLIPLKLRKIVAAYYTNSQAGDLLASLAVENANDTVFDPACGSGTLLISSYHQKKALFALSRPFDDAAICWTSCGN